MISSNAILVSIVFRDTDIRWKSRRFFPDCETLMPRTACSNVALSMLRRTNVFQKGDGNAWTHGSIVETVETFSGPSFRGRPIKFTPERIQQIKNLVERGKSREDIAELVGVTVGSRDATDIFFGGGAPAPFLHLLPCPMRKAPVLQALLGPKALCARAHVPSGAFPELLPRSPIQLRSPPSKPC